MESLGKAAVYFVIAANTGRSVRNNSAMSDWRLAPDSRLGADAVELLDSGVLKALDKVKPGRASVLVDQPTGTEYKVVYYSQALWTSVQPVSTIKIDETP